eukprot:gene26117-11836_t
MTSCACQVCDSQGKWPFPSHANLQEHLYSQHYKSLCHVCIQAGKHFVLELQPMTDGELEKHTKSEHAWCEFCCQHFYGTDDLYTHMTLEHFSCHVCQRGGQHHVYFKDAAGLQEHCSTEHFCCDHGDCADCFTAFQTEEELKQHWTLRHSRSMPRWDNARARPLILDLRIGTAPVSALPSNSSFGGRGARGRGTRGRASAATAYDLSFPAQLALSDQRQSSRPLELGEMSLPAQPPLSDLRQNSRPWELGEMQDMDGGLRVIDDDLGMAAIWDTPPAVREPEPSSGSGRTSSQAGSREFGAWSPQGSSIEEAFPSSSGAGTGLRAGASDIQRAAPTNGQRPAPTNGQRPVPSNGQRSSPSIGESFPVLGTGTGLRAGVSDIQRAAPTNGQRPAPSNSQRPAPSIERSFPSLGAVVGQRAGQLTVASSTSYTASSSASALTKVAIRCPCGCRTDSFLSEEQDMLPTMACDSGCAAKARLADAFGGENMERHVNYFNRKRMPCYSAALIRIAQENSSWANGVERDIAVFLSDPSATRTSLQPMARAQRDLVQELAEHGYGLATSLLGCEPKRCVQLIKTAGCGAPQLKLSTMARNMDEEELAELEAATSAGGKTLKLFDVAPNADIERHLREWRGEYTISQYGSNASVIFKHESHFRTASDLLAGGVRGLFRVERATAHSVAPSFAALAAAAAPPPCIASSSTSAKAGWGQLSKPRAPPPCSARTEPGSGWLVVKKGGSKAVPAPAASVDPWTGEYMGGEAEGSQRVQPVAALADNWDDEEEAAPSEGAKSKGGPVKDPFVGNNMWQALEGSGDEEEKESKQEEEEVEKKKEEVEKEKGAAAEAEEGRDNNDTSIMCGIAVEVSNYEVTGVSSGVGVGSAGAGVEDLKAVEGVVAHAVTETAVEVDVGDGGLLSKGGVGEGVMHGTEV